MDEHEHAVTFSSGYNQFQLLMETVRVGASLIPN